MSVKALQQATGFSREATTDAAGQYVISLLPVGLYTITTEKTGFETYRVIDVIVNLNENIRVDVPLSLGKVQESVSVNASGVGEVETRSATLGKVIDETKIQELPLNARNFLNLAVLQPGVVPAMSLGSNNTPEFPGGEKSDFQVNGLRLQSNNFLLDGADNNEPFLGTAMATPSPDALEEFKILTNNYGAEFGGGGGSIVNIITKGGTNQFHGSVYEFFRNDALDAENFFAIKKDELRRNQFGGTFGGPIVKDSTFFFLNYEGFRLRQGQTQIATVPSDLQRTGNFGPAGTITAIDPTAAALLPLIPRANVGTNEFVSSPVQVQNTDQFNARIDQKLSSKNYLGGRYFLLDGSNDRNFTNTLFGVPINLPEFPLKDNYRIQNLALTDTHFFTNAFSNELRFGFNRGRFDSAISGIVRDPASFGFNLPSTKAVKNMPLIALAGYTAFGAFNDSPSYRRENTFQIQDNVSWVKGRHTLKYGAQILRNQMNIPSSDSIGEGAFLFLPEIETATTNYVPIRDAFANFLQGQFNLFTQAGGVTTRAWRFSSYNFYVQDELRVAHNLTLTLGLRYELPIPPVDTKNRVDAYRPGAQSIVHPNAPPGLLFVGDAGITRSTIQTDKDNFAPRLGFAWDPKGDGKMSLHGGYGIFYDRLIGLLPFQFGLDPPFDIIPSIPNVVENRLPGSTFGNPFSGGSPFAGKTAQQVADANIFPPFSFLQVMDPRMRTPYVQQWNLTYQIQAGKDTVLEAGYVGTKGTKIVQPVDLNTQIGVERPLEPNFFQLSNYQTTDNSNYQALQLSANKRMGNGLTFLSSYTWSHSIDGGSIPVNFLNPNSEAIFPEDRLNLRLDRGNSAYDARHRFVLSAIYALPFFKSGNGFAPKVLGNWQVNGILTWQSGFPFTILDTSDPNRDGQPTDRPNQIGDPFGPGTRTPQKWFDATAFEHPPTGTDGLVSRNSLPGPRISNTDFGLFKNFPITERQKLQFRAEFFNLFNHPNFDIPVNDFNSPAVGQIHDTRLPNRQVQFALKYSF